MGERVVDCGEEGILEGGLGGFCNLCVGGGGWKGCGRGVICPLAKPRSLVTSQVHYSLLLCSLIGIADVVLYYHIYTRRAQAGM